MDIRALAYIRIEATDLDPWREFGTSILGMMIAPGMPRDTNLYLKMDEYSYRYCIIPGAEDRFACAGWEVPGREAFEQALSELEAAGVAYRLGSAEAASERNVRAFASLQDPAGHDLEICYNPRHHSLALYEDSEPHPGNLVHLMAEVPTLDDFGHFMDRIHKAGTRVVTGMGRHTNDKMVSTYVESPAGFALEYGFDGVQVDWQNYTPTESSTTSHWGHRWNQG